MSNQQQEILREARIFGKYLVGQSVSDATCNLYSLAIEAHGLKSTGKDEKIEKFILRFPFWIGFVDGALALTNKKSVVRKKIYVMFAVLEVVPEYCDYFLPKKYSLWGVIKVFAAGIRSVYRFAIGIILVKII